MICEPFYEGLDRRLLLKKSCKIKIGEIQEVK